MADMISVGDLAEMQRFAESRMRDTCVVSAPGGSVTLDPETGEPTVTAGAAIYSGPCRLRMPGTMASWKSTDVGGDSVALSQPVLSVPVSAPKIPVGSIVVLGAGPAGDPGAHLRAGQRFSVIGTVMGTDVTAQRVTVEAVTG